LSASRTVGIVKAAQFTDRLLKTISEKGFQIAGSVLLAGITLLIFVNVIFRYLLNQPLDYSQEIVEVILSLIAFWGIAICTSRQGHVAIDVIVKRFSPKAQAVIGSIIYFLTTALFGIMTWRFFKYAFDNPESVTNILRLPKYIFVIIIGLTSIVITLLFFTQFIQILKRTASR
jgi:TRAP-type C4-dicarboxylate transport system permease small subunit